MKKLFAIFVFLSVICPAVFAEWADDVALDQELISKLNATVNGKTQPTSLDKLIISTPSTVQKEFDIKLMGDSIYPSGDDDSSEEFEDQRIKEEPADDGSKIIKVKKYNLVSILVPVNKSILEQVEVDKSSDELKVYFKDTLKNHILVDVAQMPSMDVMNDFENDYDSKQYYFNLDYDFSFFNPEDAIEWKNTDPAYRSIEGKILRLRIRYSPKHFHLLQMGSTNPVNRRTYASRTRIYTDFIIYYRSEKDPSYKMGIALLADPVYIYAKFINKLDPQK